jgi:outer membrane receptor protein involved in Fe transport
VGQLRLSRRFDLAVTGRFTSGFPSTPPVGLKISSVPDEQDVDGDGNRTELIPERDKAGRLVYALDLGSIANMNTARQPAYARVDARLTYKPRSGRLSVYLDVINVFNRKNVGMMEHQLEYDPNSDRPRIVEQGKGSIPFLPSLGVHYRF